MLFAFDPRLKADRFIKDEIRKEKYIKRGEEFQVNLVKFCIKNPSFNLLVKAKTSRNSYKDFWMMLNKYNISIIPNNIKIINKGSSFSLINKSFYVSGFLSTTLIESVILDKPIICPNMTDILGNNKFDFFFNFTSLVNYVKNYNEMKNLLTNIVDTNMPLSTIKEKFLKPLIFSLDGKSAHNTEKEIIKVIDEYKLLRSN